MRRLGITTLLLSTALLLSCTLQQQQGRSEQTEQAEEPKITLPPPLHLGAVHQVYPEQNFALLRMLGPVPAPGTTLISHPADGSNDRVGNLCVSQTTGSRNGIIAADIRSGTVVKGDRVFLYREIAAPESREQEPDFTDDTDSPADTEADNGDDTQLPAGEDTAPVLPDAEPAAAADTEPVQQVETTVLPESSTPALPATGADGAPDTVPDSIRDVPDTIEGWNNF